MRKMTMSRHDQKGAVAIIVGLSLAVLVGFAGLALDGGQLYVTKTELQNAADACALAAAYELTGAPNIPAESFTRAENAGTTVATEGKVGFQGAQIASGAVTVEFGTTLSGGSWTSASGASGASKYVRCTIARPAIKMWFMQVLGFGDQTVSAFATATLAPAQTNCAIPLALCTDSIAGGLAPHYGYVKGQWYSMNFVEKSNGSTDNLTGNFRWIDFDPSSTTPGCSGGGASELACVLEGAGQCNLPGNGPANCSGASPGNPIAGCVGQTGNITSLSSAFNTRFGIYKGGSVSPSDLTVSPPDFTGFAYTTTTWPLGHDAYSGSYSGINNFLSARAANTPVQSSEVPNGSNAATSSQLAQYGSDRRLVTIPFVECAGMTSSQQAPVRGYACILLLSPYKKDSGNVVRVEAEYLGRSNEAGSPCATSGAVGGASSIGPMVPALVQ